MNENGLGNSLPPPSFGENCVMALVSVVVATITFFLIGFLFVMVSLALGETYKQTGLHSGYLLAAFAVYCVVEFIKWLAKPVEERAPTSVVLVAFATLLSIAICVGLGGEGGYQLSAFSDAALEVFADGHEFVLKSATFDERPADPWAEITLPASTSREARLDSLIAFGGRVRGEALMAAAIGAFVFTKLATAWVIFSVCFVVFRNRHLPESERLNCSPPAWGVYCAGIALCLAIATYCGTCSYDPIRSQVSVVAKLAVVMRSASLEQQAMKEFAEHQQDPRTGIVAPNRSLEKLAEELQGSRDVEYCDATMQDAYRDYALAWKDLGQLVAQETGLPGVAKAMETGGVSLLDALFVQSPTKVKAVRTAREKLLEPVPAQEFEFPTMFEMLMYPLPAG